MRVLAGCSNEVRTSWIRWEALLASFGTLLSEVLVIFLHVATSDEIIGRWAWPRCNRTVAGLTQWKRRKSEANWWHGASGRGRVERGSSYGRRAIRHLVIHERKPNEQRSLIDGDQVGNGGGGA